MFFCQSKLPYSLGLSRAQINDVTILNLNNLFILLLIQNRYKMHNENGHRVKLKKKLNSEWYVKNANQFAYKYYILLHVLYTHGTQSDMWFNLFD